MAILRNISFVIIVVCSIFFFSSKTPVFADYRTEASVSTDIGTPQTGSTAANNNDCGGKYRNDFNLNTVLNFGPKNFGDPGCEFDKTKLATLITSLDPANKYRWYNVIAWCESRYDPNAEEVQGAVDAAHAWGLFQMGRGKNGILDHGDVPWRQQTSNAINYNKTKINGSFLYWQTRNYDPTTCS